MLLRDIMTPGVAEISPNATLQDAAEQMRSHDIGVLPVYSADRVVGILTDRDIAVRAVAAGRDPNHAKVSDIMSSSVTSCFEDDALETAAAVMEEKQIRRLIVLDHNKKVVGIVSLGDLARHGYDRNLSAEVLERVSEPSEKSDYASPT
jgi:CBS domain-containing protein